MPVGQWGSGAVGQLDHPPEIENVGLEMVDEHFYMVHSDLRWFNCSSTSVEPGLTWPVFRYLQSGTIYLD